MKATTYFVRLNGGYYHKEKSKSVTFNIDESSFTVKTSQIVFWEPTKDQQSMEFLIEVTEDQLKVLKTISQVNFDFRGNYGTGSLPPRGGFPPPKMEILRWLLQ